MGGFPGQLVEYLPLHQKVAGSFAGRGLAGGSRSIFYSHISASLSLSLSSSTIIF